MRLMVAKSMKFGGTQGRGNPCSWIGTEAIPVMSVQMFSQKLSVISNTQGPINQVPLRTDKSTPQGVKGIPEVA
jgi:hypothetical protein